MIAFIQVCPPEILSTLQTVGSQNSWEKMLNTYDEKYKLTQFYARKLQNMSEITVPSSGSISQLLTEFDEIKKAFEKIGATYEALTMFSLVNKLDQVTLRACNRYRRTLAE